MDFNPRSRKGSDQMGIALAARLKNFNPRSRKGSDVTTDLISTVLYQFQSTLPQGERHLPGAAGFRGGDISIHAPARGATRLTGQKRTWRSNFNPRSRKGSDVSGWNLYS